MEKEDTSLEDFPDKDEIIEIARGLYNKIGKEAEETARKFPKWEKGVSQFIMFWIGMTILDQAKKVGYLKEEIEKFFEV